MFPYESYDFILFCKECHWDFDSDCVEFACQKLLYSVDRNSVTTIETVWGFLKKLKRERGFLKKLKREIPYDPAISFLCIHPK